MSISSIGSRSAIYESQSIAESAATASASYSINDSISLSAANQTDPLTDLNGLYEQKAQAENTVNEIKGQTDEVQSQIDSRKGEISQEYQNDDASAQLNEKYQEAQAEYQEASAAKSAAQQEVTQLNQDKATNSQAIATNAQQTQQASSELSAAQSELASLTPPQAPSGDDPEAQADYQAQMADYEAQKAAIEARIDAAQQELDKLQAEQQQLQAEQQQIDADLQNAQNEMTQQDAAMQTAQAQMDEIQNSLSENNPELQEALDEDSELQSLQSDFEELQQQQTEAEQELSDIEAQIAEAEANNSSLQAQNAENTTMDLLSTADEAGCDVNGSIADSQDAVAQKEYGKSYTELNDAEKMALEAKVDGEVTLNMMDQARKMLEEDPDNADAKAVLEKGQQSLDAQEKSARANLLDSKDSLPDDLKYEANQAMKQAWEEAKKNGSDPDAAAMAALADYAYANADNANFGPDKLEALQSLAKSSDSYAEAIGRTDKGQDISDKLAAKQKMAEELGISASEIIEIDGGDGNNNISITAAGQGGVAVTVDGKTTEYSQEDAQRLFIAGGAGKDTINVDGKVKQDMHLYGGVGDDTISGGAGKDTIYGGKGDDAIHGGNGVDTISGGEGVDVISGGLGLDNILADISIDKISDGLVVKDNINGSHEDPTLFNYDQINGYKDASLRLDDISDYGEKFNEAWQKHRENIGKTPESKFTHGLDNVTTLVSTASGVLDGVSNITSGIEDNDPFAVSAGVGGIADSVSGGIDKYNEAAEKFEKGPKFERTSTALKGVAAFGVVGNTVGAVKNFQEGEIAAGLKSSSDAAGNLSTTLEFADTMNQARVAKKSAEAASGASKIDNATDSAQTVAQQVAEEVAKPETAAVPAGETAKATNSTTEIAGDAGKVTDTPKTEAPKTDAPKAEAPKTDAPKAEAPKTDTPKTDATNVAGDAGKAGNAADAAGDAGKAGKAADAA
ncbi:MAG: hypothetical protein Q4F00_13745, partial [bacterium]|nr:hypothetical protein [bacterium]